ncbi:uncharacterized protein LOC105663731 isoform X2 [Megachile rotundata]|uniref:uncharacterized protein LOC105663731 isoform X2 n=1 Tax=Megachile rotundata TaxID=143995 RepID=UPI0006149BDC|nr:PREDICTED: uncharacterized protein LOC105663731 [Megachile rotundata]
MYPRNILKNYILSQYTMERLDVIKEKLREDTSKSDPLWQIIIGKETDEEKEEGEGGQEEEEEDDVFKEENVAEEEVLNERNVNNTLSKPYNEFTSTQFYFTQVDKSCEKENKQERIKKFDILECLFEGLEGPNGKLDLSQLDSLTDEELLEIVCELEKKLSMLGTYNLCCSLNNMTLEQQIKYATIFHKHLLLPKIIALDKPSRLLVSVISEQVKKFPNDIEKLIFIPLLNVDLKDTTIVNAIINAFEPERNISLIREYLAHVKELKAWHLSILHSLISTKTDITTNDKLIQLLSEKAFDFAKNKDFGKLILSFIKINANFSDQQKHLLREIANINQTLFKNPIQNMLNSM